MELFSIHSNPSERRAFLRKKCDIPVMGLGTIRDIGLGGLYLETSIVPKSQDVAVVFELDSDKTVIANAVVVNQRGANSGSGCGLKFVSIDVNSRVHILNYVNERTERSSVEEDVRSSLDQFLKSWPDQYSLVSTEFKREIADFRLYLNQLKTALIREERKLSVLPTADKIKACESVIEFHEKDLQEKVHLMILAVNEVIKDFSETEHELHRSYFQEQLLDFTNDSEFFNRAMHKPLGYAGDYMMMEILYHGTRQGETLWHKVINSCLTSLPMGDGVRNRAWYLSNKILKTLESRLSPDIMSLACGPCPEVEIVFEKSPSKGNYYLVDQDKEALQHAQNKLARAQFKTKAVATLDFRNDSVKRFLKDSKGIIDEYPKMD